MEQNQHILFFLNLSDKLPQYYFKLAEDLTKFNIQLVPIETKDLPAFAQSRKIFVLMIFDTNGKKKRVDDIKVSTLNQLYRFNRLHIFEVSSFAPLFQERLGRGKVEKNYFFFQLPLKFDELVGELVKDYFEAQQVENVWPGGKRPKRQIDPGDGL